MVLVPGALLGERYNVVSVLGKGGFATVYAATHAVLGSPHAIKVLHGGQGGGARERMLEEGRMMARLVHPNLVRVTDVVPVDDGVALVMDLVEGETLRSLLDRGPVPMDRALGLALGILDGVAAVHAAGLVHRDLKPDNVLIGRDGVPRVTDFGIARGVEVGPGPTGPRPRQGMGTPGYMSPEAYTDFANLDARADVYALGTLLFELWTGNRAFPAGLSPTELHHRAAQGAFPRLETLAPGLPPHIAGAVRAAMAPDREARPPDAGALGALVRGRGDWEAPPPQARHQLPAERDSFVGRQVELGLLAQRLLEGARLVTVLGIGGTGKTRLVTHFGWKHLDRWSGGVWFCDLAEARDSDGVLRAVADGLDTALDRDPAAQLGRALRGRGRCLVILDNLEQVTRPAADLLGRWMDAAPQTAFVVTSRERIGLVGEVVLRLDPLDQAAAESLFLARAASAQAEVPPEDRGAVTDLVKELDYLPLAIELAAARARMLSPAAMLARMKDRFRLLRASGGRPDRHATLRATLDWSWELLPPEEAAALAQLSVFSGGFSLAAAEAVLALGEAWPMDVMQALVDRSLVRVVSRDRMDLLGVVQAYAAERLDDLGERAATEARHGACFAELGDEEALDTLSRAGGVARRQMLALDLDNALQASRRAVARGDAAVAGATARLVWSIVEQRGPFGLARELLDQVLRLPDLAPRLRIRLLWNAGRAADLCGRGELADARFQEGLELARELGDLRLEGLGLGGLGILRMNQGFAAEAVALYEQAHGLMVASGAEGDEATALGNLGAAYMQVGRLAEALARDEAALALHRRLGNRTSEGRILGNLAVLYNEQGRMADARRGYEQALAIHREVGNRRGEGLVLANLGNLHADLGQLDQADAYYAAALAVARDLGDRRVEALITSNLGALQLERGQTAEARASLMSALALHLEGGNQRGQGIVEGLLGRLCLHEGDLDAAARWLSDGEARLREVRDPGELALLLCRRAELEHARGDAVRARGTLAEVRAGIAPLGLGPDTPLGRALAAAQALMGEGLTADA